MYPSLHPVIANPFEKPLITSVLSFIPGDDQITVYGVSLGDYTYEAVMGNAVTVPLIMVDKIDQ